MALSEDFFSALPCSIKKRTPLSVLSVQHIRKSYGLIRALKDVSFEVPEGSVFGILGPNGSGKTTLLGTVLNVLLADSGNYSWFNGLQPDAARQQVGSLLETPNFYHYLSADDNLEIAASIKGRGKDDITRVLGLVNLLERRTSKFSTYSLGMKQRLAIASALLGNPKVLVLDEPTNGLDPVGIAEIRELIKSLSAHGITVIMASHLLYEVEKVCTHVAILKRGDLLVTGTVAEVMRAEDTIEVSAADIGKLQSMLKQLPAIKKIISGEGLLQLIYEGNVHPEMINAYSAQQGITLSHLLLKKRSLESVFMELTDDGSVS